MPFQTFTFNTNGYFISLEVQESYFGPYRRFRSGLSSNGQLEYTGRSCDIVRALFCRLRDLIIVEDECKFTLDKSEDLIDM